MGEVFCIATPFPRVTISNVSHYVKLERNHVELCEVVQHRFANIYIFQRLFIASTFLCQNNGNGTEHNDTIYKTHSDISYR